MRLGDSIYSPSRLCYVANRVSVRVDASVPRQVILTSYIIDPNDVEKVTIVGWQSRA